MIDKLFINSLNEEVSKIINREKKKKIQSKQKEEKSSFWKKFTSDSFINVINDLTSNIMIKENIDYGNPDASMEEIDKNSVYLLEFTGFSKYISDYKKLNSELKKEIEIFSKKSLDNILYKIISYMSNFNVNKDIMKILIIDYCAQFGFNNESKQYYINLIDAYHSKNYLY